MPPLRIVCLGEVMIELSLQDDQPNQAGLSFAGDTYNTAVYLKRAAPSLDVVYATKLGRDRLSDRLVTQMEAEGIDSALVERCDSRMPGLYAISTDAAGERSFLYWRDQSAARSMFDMPGLTLDALATSDVLYFSAISLAILPQPARMALLDWLPAYRAAGGRVAFDSNFRPALWPDRETARRDVEAAMRETDIALPSVDDECALFGDEDAASVLARLQRWGVTEGALKCGADGPVPLDGSAAGPFPPAATVLDSTAAGDSFNAGYLGARLTGGAPAECLAAGHALASHVIGVRGAIIPRH